MTETRIHQLLETRYDCKPFSFKMDLYEGRCTEGEIRELVELGYIRRISGTELNDYRYKVTQKGKEYLTIPLEK